MVAITSAAIDLPEVARSVQHAQAGAVVLFTGVVRALSDDLRPVTGLEYEAHEALAVAEIESIAAQARERFGPCAIAAVHRTGALAVGDIAVAVAVAAPHRAQAFDACAFTIDAIKARAPIWKKERYADGTSTWRENDCHPQAAPSTP